MGKPITFYMEVESIKRRGPQTDILEVRAKVPSDSYRRASLHFDVDSPDLVPHPYEVLVVTVANTRTESDPRPAEEPVESLEPTSGVTSGGVILDGDLVIAEEIVVAGQYSGYLLYELEAHMDTEELKRWREWSRGITMALHKGDSLVYSHDWAIYKAGLPNPD